MVKLFANTCKNFPKGVISDVFIASCVLSKTPIVCAYCVVAWWGVILRTTAVSCIILETKIELSSVISIIGGKEMYR